MIVKVAKNMIFQMPDFIHEHGHRGHHQVPMINAYTKPSVRNWVKAEIHEIIEEYLLYPLKSFLIGRDARRIGLLNIPLTFVWGLVCGFPFRDIVNYTVWYARGCATVRTWKKIDGKWEVQQ
jgi:hypothetical protein